MTSTEESAVHPTEVFSSDALSSLFQATSGLRNMRAAGAMLICFALSVVVSGLLSIILGKGMTGMSVATLTTLFLIASGIHAGGLLLMDQAKSIQMMSIPEAIGVGVWCALRSIALIIIIVLTLILVYLLMALVLFVCKMPWFGPLLYAIAFPVSVLVMGLTFTGLFLCLMIAVSAMWDGATVIGALAKALAVLRARLVETVVMTFVVFLLASFVFTFVSLILTTGFVPAVAMSAFILDASPQIYGSSGVSLFDRGPSFGGFGEGGSYLVAGSIGGSLLFALTMTLVFQVWLLGINKVYLKVTEGIDSSTTESAFRSGLSEARRKAKEISSKAKYAAEKAQAQAAQTMERSKPSSTEIPPDSTSQVRSSEKLSAGDSLFDLKQAPPSVLTCPACFSGTSPEHKFCSACGHRISIN